MNIGNNIKLLRKNMKLTQKELASLLDISPSTVTKYENNQLEPSLNTLLCLASIFNTTPNNLLQSNGPSLNGFNNLCFFSQHYYSISDFFNLVCNKSKLNNLNFKYDPNESLSIDFFEKLSNEINLSDEETSFLIVLFLKNTDDQIYKIIEFHQYLKENYGLELCKPNEVFMDTYKNLSVWIDLNLNLDFIIFSQREVAAILTNIDNYQKILMLLKDTSNDFTKDEENKLKNLSIEESTLCFNSLVDSLKFNLFKINTKKSLE